MAIALNHIGQISLTVDDLDVAERFYGAVLGLRKLYRFGDLLFFDCAGVRLYVQKSDVEPFAPVGSCLYFRIPDIALAARELRAKGVRFDGEPHLVAPMEDHDLWMAFFRDPAGNSLALMHEAPKGYKPD